MKLSHLFMPRLLLALMVILSLLSCDPSVTPGSVSDSTPPKIEVSINGPGLRLNSTITSDGASPAGSSSVGIGDLKLGDTYTVILSGGDNIALDYLSVNIPETYLAISEITSSGGDPEITTSGFSKSIKSSIPRDEPKTGILLTFKLTVRNLNGISTTERLIIGASDYPSGGTFNAVSGTIYFNLVTPR